MLISFLKHHVGREDLTGYTNPVVSGISTIDLCTEPGNGMRLFISQDADTYGNFIASNSYLEDDGYHEQEEREDHRADCCSSMSLPLHTSPYETRVVVLRGKMSLIRADLRDDESGLLRAIAQNEAGEQIAITCNKAVEDATTVNLFHGDECIIAPEELRTYHVSSNAVWIEYYRGTPSTAFDPTRYTYANDYSLDEDTQYVTGTPLNSEECMVMIARVIGQVIEAEKRKKKDELAEARAEEGRQRLATARETLRANPSLRAYNSGLPLTSAVTRALRAITGCEFAAHMYPSIGASTWDGWVQWIESTSTSQLNLTRFYDAAAISMVHQLMARPVTRDVTPRTTRSDAGLVFANPFVTAAQMSSEETFQRYQDLAAAEQAARQARTN